MMYFHLQNPVRYVYLKFEQGVLTLNILNILEFWDKNKTIIINVMQIWLAFGQVSAHVVLRVKKYFINKQTQHIVWAAWLDRLAFQMEV